MLHEWEMEEGGISFFLEKSEGKCSRGRPKIKWEDNFNMDLMEINYEGDWKTLAQSRVTWRAYVLAAMNFGFHNANDLELLISYIYR